MNIIDEIKKSERVGLIGNSYVSLDNNIHPIEKMRSVVERETGKSYKDPIDVLLGLKEIRYFRRKTEDSSYAKKKSN